MIQRHGKKVRVKKRDSPNFYFRCSLINQHFKGVFTGKEKSFQVKTFLEVKTLLGYLFLLTV